MCGSIHLTLEELCIELDYYINEHGIEANSTYSFMPSKQYRGHYGLHRGTHSIETDVIYFFIKKDNDEIFTQCRLKQINDIDDIISSVWWKKETNIEQSVIIGDITHPRDIKECIETNMLEWIDELKKKY